MICPRVGVRFQRIALTAANQNTVTIDVCEAHARERWVVGWKYRAKKVAA